VISNGTVNDAPSISSDGQFIAFTSNATNLGSGVSSQQIYLRDNIAGTTTLISKTIARFHYPAMRPVIILGSVRTAICCFRISCD
jgi:Tol biopolymer transport system component